MKHSIKIATWNLRRPNSRTKSRNEIFKSIIQKMDADILILTETNNQLDLKQQYMFCSTTTILPENHEGFHYYPGEIRTAIYSKFPISPAMPVSDYYTSVCPEIMTPFGLLLIYGTIIGVTGGRDARFKADLKQQLADLSELSNRENICIAGDFNTSFATIIIIPNMAEAPLPAFLAKIIW